MNKSEILKEYGIPKSLWDTCFVDETKGIWQPQMDEFGEIIKTGEALYIESLNPPLPPQPTPEEMVITEMSMSMAQMQAESNQAIAELTTVIAMLQIPMV